MNATRPPVELTRDGGAIAVLKLDRTDKRNALNLALLETLPVLLEQAALDRNIRVLIVTGGAFGTFSAGADIDELTSLVADTTARDRFCASFAAAQTAMSEFPKPSIAMISGACVGGGCGLALGCDIRIADNTVKLGITPAKLGLAYSVTDTRRLVDAVGYANAADLLFSGRLIGAEEAKSIGLVSRVVDPEVLESSTLEFARLIASNAPSSLSAIKAVLRAIKAGRTGDDDTSRRIFAAAFEGSDFSEGLAAFFERRSPEFG